jgi:hypothetical protein
MNLDMVLYQPLIMAIARETAKLVLAGLRQESPSRRWADTNDAAERLGITTTALRQRKSSGQIPDDCFVKMEGSVRWDLEALDRWMESLHLQR